MDDYFANRKRVLDKFRSELTLDEDDGMDANFEAAYPEACPQILCEASLEQCTSLPGRLELHPAHRLSAVPKPILNTTEGVTNGMVKIKEERIEDSPFYSEPSVDKQQYFSSETVYLPVYEESAFTSEKTSIKVEDDLEEESTALNANRQADFSETEKETKVEESSVGRKRYFSSETVYLPAYEGTAFTKEEIRVKTEDVLEDETTASNTNRQVDFSEAEKEMEVKEHSTNNTLLFPESGISDKVENGSADKSIVPVSIPPEIASTKLNREKISPPLSMSEHDANYGSVIHSPGMSFIHANKMTSYSAQNHINFQANEQPSTSTEWSASYQLNTHFTLISDPHSNQKYYLCNKCSAQFKRPSDLRKHLVSHSNDRTFSCEVCFAGFKRKGNLKEHMLIHSSEKAFPCEQCSAVFNQNCKLKKHMLIHSNEKEFSCEECSAKFNQKSNLKKHMLIHSNEKAFSCKECSAQFKQKAHLQRHVMIHTNEKPYICDQCSAQFNHISNLKVHLLIHSNEKAFTCELCSAKFNYVSYLKRHMLIHSNEKAFSCEVCFARFRRKGNLREHMLVHSDTKAYSCEQCPAKFNLKYKLKKHLLVHSNEKVFFCQQCSAKFRHRMSLQKHLVTHSNEKALSCEQ